MNHSAKNATYAAAHASVSTQQNRHHGDELFIQIEDWAVDLLISDEMTKTERRLFWYLFKLDRWGDRYVDLPSQSEIALALGVRRETINLAQAKLQQLGLWDVRITKWKGRNSDFSRYLFTRWDRLLCCYPKVLFSHCHCH